jgi:bifunctional enzyme CysN/CysC
MTRLEARDPEGIPTRTAAGQNEPTVTRLAICGAAHAGATSLLSRLRHQTAPLAAEILPASAAPAASGAGFRTARRAYAAVATLWQARDASGLAAGAFDLALIVIDACTGVVAQTRRHSYLVSRAGLRNVLAVVNRIDLTGYAQIAFDPIEAEYRAFAARLGLSVSGCVPVSALLGDNIATPSSQTSWYRGPTLCAALDAIPISERSPRADSLRVMVQHAEPAQGVSRPGILGLVASGCLRRGERIRVQPRGHESMIERIVHRGSEVELAYADQCVTLTLADPIEVARGDLIAALDAPASVADQFEAIVVWTGRQPLLRGRNYQLQCGAAEAVATVAPLKHKINLDTLDKVAATQLECDEIGEVALELDRPIAFDPYQENARTGGFVLIDRISQEQVGVGMLLFALRRSENLHWQALEVDKKARQRLAGHGSGVVWMTGLSGAGKSTLANMLEKRLHARGFRTYLLDGDNVRHGLSKDLGFTAADRVENIRRIAEVAKLMVDAGVIVIAAFISPFRAERRMARELLQPGEFIEVFVDAPLPVAESRDPKGLYAKARRGELKNFTGIDSPYEIPEDPEVHVDTAASSIERALEDIYEALIRHRLIDRA